MGLGKTLQLLAVTAVNRDPARTAAVAATLAARGADAAAAPTAARSALARLGVSLRPLGDRDGIDFDGGALSAARDAFAEMAASGGGSGGGGGGGTLAACVAEAVASSVAAAQPFGPKPADADDPLDGVEGAGACGHAHPPVKAEGGGAGGSAAPAGPSAAAPARGRAPHVKADPTATTPADDATASGYSHATLVVCPMSACLQWAAEADRFFAPGTLTVRVHHGGKRTADPRLLSSSDLVITSFGTLESEFRRSGAAAAGAPRAVKCGRCGKPYAPDALPAHLLYYCDVTGKRTEKQALAVRKAARKGGKRAAAAAACAPRRRRRRR